MIQNTKEKMKILDDNSEKAKEKKENWKVYMRGYMKKQRENKPKTEIVDNKKEKINDEKIKKDSPRKDYMKSYFRERSGFQEPKIKNPEDYVSNLWKYPANFPKEEFNKSLDWILKDKPLEVGEKKLKDILYDILDRKGTLTPTRMLSIYYNPIWTKTIEEFMLTRDYSRNEEEIYFPKNKEAIILQSEQK